MTIIVSRRNKFFITTDGGTTWQPHCEMYPFYLVRQIIAFDKCGDRMLVNAVSGIDSVRGLYLTTNGGEKWRKVFNYPAQGESMYFSSDTSIIACAAWRPFGLWVSMDHGQSWHSRLSRNKIPWSTRVCSIGGLNFHDHTRYIIGCQPPELLVTDDTGKTFRSIPIGLPRSDGEIPQITVGSDSFEVYACVAFSNRLGEGGIYRSSDFGTKWERMKSPESLWCMLADKSHPGRLIVVQCMPHNQCGGDSCSKPCMEVSVQNVSYNWLVSKVDVTCVGGNGMAICSALDDNGLLWTISPGPYNSCNTAAFADATFTPPLGTSGLTQNKFLHVKECGCCKFDVTVYFSCGGPPCTFTYDIDSCKTCL